MKQKMSISIEEESVKIIEDIVKNGRFRSKSHVLEYALDRFLRGDEDE